MSPSSLVKADQVWSAEWLSLATPSGCRVSELDLDDANQKQDHDNDDDHADDPDATIS
jgi:hypothetical protein